MPMIQPMIKAVIKIVFFFNISSPFIHYIKDIKTMSTVK